MKALVVEDEFTNRIILQKFLSRHSEVQTCSNGLEAVEAFRAALDSGSPFHLICMDFMMPVMDGGTALMEIRAAEQEKGIFGKEGVKVIMTTGLEESDAMLGDIKALCDGILIKPVRLNVLLDTLASLGLL